MKTMHRKGYILIVSEPLIKFFAMFMGDRKLSKGCAIFPFIIVRSQEYILPWLLNHERIHLRQQIELLIVGFYLLSWGEFLYARIVLGKSKFEAYVWGSAEQEAYRFMHDDAYLGRRKCWSQFKYIKGKKKISFTGPGQVIFE